MSLFSLARSFCWKAGKVALHKPCVDKLLLSAPWTHSSATIVQNLEIFWLPIESQNSAHTLLSNAINPSLFDSMDSRWEFTNKIDCRKERREEAMLWDPSLERERGFCETTARLSARKTSRLGVARKTARFEAQWIAPLSGLAGENPGDKDCVRFPSRSCEHKRNWGTKTARFLPAQAYGEIQLILCVHTCATDAGDTCRILLPGFLNTCLWRVIAIDAASGVFRSTVHV